MQDMEQMPPEGGAPEADGAGKMVDLAKQGGEILSQLAAAIDASPAATDEDRAQAAQIMDLYIDLVERQLGGASPGESPDAVPADPGMMPAMGGAKGVPMGPQGRG